MITPGTDFPFAKIPPINDKNLKATIRKKNLQDVIDTLNKHKIQYWLYGKTLLGMVRDGKLIENDHDEDVGIWLTDINRVLELVYPDLVSLGFKPIRFTKTRGILSFLRNNRYIDLCFFSNFEKDMVGYELKRIPSHFLNSFDTICREDYTYFIPKNSTKLLQLLYK